MRFINGLIVACAFFSANGLQAQNDVALSLAKIKLPPGFSIGVYASGLKDARSMTLGANGTLFVGTRVAGNVYAIAPSGEKYTIASGLNSPNGVAFKDGSLYVAEINRVLRFDNIESRLKTPPKPTVVNDSFPDKAHHGWKFMKFGPDGYLYVPVGAPCNVCKENDQRFASIMRFKPGETQPEVFASGIRNTVGFDWDPETKELWFTDNGRDSLGDNVPPDELNRAPSKGMNFGFPYCHGGTVPDPNFGRDRSCSEFTPPELSLPAHVAALGMRFYTGQAFPESYRNQIFIAEHGSWNRSSKVGYRVVIARREAGKPVREEVFAEGWLQNGSAWGRPVDIQVAPDGSLFVSDDQAGAIYQIRYQAPVGSEERN